MSNYSRLLSDVGRKEKGIYSRAKCVPLGKNTAHSLAFFSPERSRETISNSYILNTELETMAIKIHSANVHTE